MTVLRESVAVAPVKAGNRWRVIVAKPGQGSSGFYSEDLFRRDAGKIIAPGGQAFINHDDSRNPKDMIGTYPEGSFWSEDDKAVVSELEVFSHWKDFVEEVGPHCGISLYAVGEQDGEGNVTEFHEDALNGADLVARPGLTGSKIAEKLYESAKAHDSDEKPGAQAQESNERNEQIMDEKLDQLIELMSSLVAEKIQKETEEVQVSADEAAVSSAVEAYDASVKAIDEAELLPSQVESLRAAAKAGADVAPLIEEAKKVKTDALAAVQAEVATGHGRVVEGADKFSLTKIAEAK